MERFFVLDKFNTWYDWRLIVTAKDVTPPEPKTNYVELDGAHGTLDLSEALTGEVTYQDRTVTATFWTDEKTMVDRKILLQTIVRALHGKKIKVVEPDDPDHYFYGRLKVKTATHFPAYMSFNVEITCEPWRYAIEETKRLIEVEAEENNVVIRNTGVKTLCPTINVTGSVTLTYNGASVELSDGSYKISDIKLCQGFNIVTVSGTGSVEFVYREADL